MLRRLRAPSLESLFIGALVLLGFRLGVLPIGDNSMFTHLRTGVDMVPGAGIPREDPYSYTARGVEWVVQSWLPEWTYGWLDKLGGFRLVVLEQAVLFAVLALLIARLARAGTPLRTALSAGLAVGIGRAFWSPAAAAVRPDLYGPDRHASWSDGARPWLLVPVVWLWVNSHGSFPLGLVWLGARAVGEWLDWKSWPRETRPLRVGLPRQPGRGHPQPARRQAPALPAHAGREAAASSRRSSSGSPRTSTAPANGSPCCSSRSSWSCSTGPG